MEGEEEPAGRDWLGELPDELVLLVCKAIPPGPVGRGDFRQLSRRDRGLANATVTKARMKGWGEAAQMGTAFPQLEELTVVQASSNGDQEGAEAFLQHSAPQLTRLVSLEVLEMEVSPGLMQQLCSAMPGLRRLSLPLLPLRGQPGGPQCPLLEVILCITQLDQLTALKFLTRDAPKEVLALLQQLPNLLSLDLSNSSLHDEQLAGLEGLTGLEGLNLNDVVPITVGGLQALLPRLQLLTCLKLLDVDLGEEGFKLLAQQTGLQHLEVWPYHNDYSGIEHLSRLQRLTMLGALGWQAECSRVEVWSLLCSSSLQALQLYSISGPAAGPQVCQVTDLMVANPGVDMPLLPRLSKLEAWGSFLLDALQVAALMRHATITELVVSEWCQVSAEDLGRLAQLPELRALRLGSARGGSEHLQFSNAVLQSALAPCTGLKRLTLAGLMLLTDPGLQWLASKLPSLRCLEVQRCDATTAEGRERALRVVARGAAARGL